MSSPATPNPRRWWALALLSVAQFLVILDTSIIGVALPKIDSALGFSSSSLQWVFNAYVIAFGGLLLLGGRLADLLGARRVFVGGFVLLVGASLFAGLATSEPMLIAGRGLQGAGAALVAPAAMAIVFGLFSEPKELGKAMGIWGASAPAGGTAGVFLGGVITEWISWRWTFLIKQTRREPLVRLGILRSRNLAAASLTIGLLGAAWIPLWFFLNLYLQQVLGYSAFASGARSEEHT